MTFYELKVGDKFKFKELRPEGEFKVTHACNGTISGVAERTDRYLASPVRTTMGYEKVVLIDETDDARR